MNSKPENSDIVAVLDILNEPDFIPKKQIGIILTFISLFLLGILPIISNSRPQELNALNYTLYFLFGNLFSLFL